MTQLFIWCWMSRVRQKNKEMDLECTEEVEVLTDEPCCSSGGPPPPPPPPLSHPMIFRVPDSILLQQLEQDVDEEVDAFSCRSVLGKKRACCEPEVSRKKACYDDDTYGNMPIVVDDNLTGKRRNICYFDDTLKFKEASCPGPEISLRALVRHNGPSLIGDVLNGSAPDNDNFLGSFDPVSFNERRQAISVYQMAKVTDLSSLSYAVKYEDMVTSLSSDLQRLRLNIKRYIQSKRPKEGEECSRRLSRHISCALDLDREVYELMDGEIPLRLNTTCAAVARDKLAREYLHFRYGQPLHHLLYHCKVAQLKKDMGLSTV